MLKSNMSRDCHDMFNQNLLYVLFYLLNISPFDSIHRKTDRYGQMNIYLKFEDIAKPYPLKRKQKINSCVKICVATSHFKDFDS